MTNITTNQKCILKIYTNHIFNFFHTNHPQSGIYPTECFCLSHCFRNRFLHFLGLHLIEVKINNQYQDNKILINKILSSLRQ